MNNFEKIKEMDLYQMAEFLINVEFNTYDFTYSDYVCKWLEQDADSPE